MHHRFAGVDYFNGHSEVWRQRFPPLYTMTAVLYLRRISFYVQLRTPFVNHSWLIGECFFYRVRWTSNQSLKRSVCVRGTHGGRERGGEVDGSHVCGR